MLPNRTIERGFLAGALTEELLLVLFSTIYLEAASLSFLLVIVVSVISSVWMTSKVREIVRRDQQALYGQAPQDSGR